MADHNSLLGGGEISLILNTAIGMRCASVGQSTNARNLPRIPVKRVFAT